MTGVAKRGWESVLEAAGVQADSGPSTFKKKTRAAGRGRFAATNVAKLDADARAALAVARLAALEGDNTRGVDVGGADAGSDDEWQEEMTVVQKSAAVGAKKAGVKRSRAEKESSRLLRRIPLADILTKPEAAEVHEAAAVPAAARGRMVPPRRLCSVCGNPSNFQCSKTGARLCSVGCLETHNEVKLLRSVG